MKLQHKLNPEVTNSPKRLLFPCSGAADQDIEPGLEASSKKTQVPDPWILESDLMKLFWNFTSIWNIIPSFRLRDCLPQCISAIMLDMCRRRSVGVEGELQGGGGGQTRFGKYPN